MRTEFHAEIDRVTAELGEMCARSATIMDDATTALVHADRSAAERIGAELAQLDRLNDCVAGRAFTLLALQAPVAHDLRVILTAFPIAASADRMGGLAANIAKVTARHGAPAAWPPVVLDLFGQMGRRAVRLAERVGNAVIADDATAACRIHDDDGMDALHGELFRTVLDERWSYGAAMAADAVLLGRFYGRFADHAIDIARRVEFRTTGHLAHQEN